MRSFIYSLILSAICLLPLSQVKAQKKQTIYYPNGKVAFEGRFRMAWGNSEKFESPGVTDPDINIIEDPDLAERGHTLSGFKDLFPSKSYEGKCKYYYRDGQLFAEGNYTSGFKNGTFKFYYPNGQLGARQSYEWGMASGHWESWDEQGRLTKSFYYQPVPENMLQRINEESIFSKRNDPPIDLKLLFGMEYDAYFKSEDRPELIPHWKNLGIFKEYVSKKLYHKAIKEGAFKVWEAGKPYLEMHFSNNIPVGTWTIYKHEKSAFVIIFEAGRITKIVDLLNLENNFGSREYFARIREAVERSNTEYMNAVDPGIPQRQEIFRTVQQKPEAGYNFSKYIEDNLKVPAKRSMTGNRVVVEFIVLRDGSIDNKVRVLRSENVEPDMIAEVIRVIRQMPKWKPGMQNGKPVDVYFSLPVRIGQQ